MVMGILIVEILFLLQHDFSKSNTIIVVSYEQEEEYKVIKAIYEINYNREIVVGYLVQNTR